MSYSGMIPSEETDDFTIFCNSDITGSDDITFSDDITISDDHTICDDITLCDVNGDHNDLINMDLHLECTDDSQYVMPEMVRQTAHSILGQNVHLKISFPKEPELDLSKRYSCPDTQCSRYFSKDHFLKQHLITKHGKKLLFNCPQCTFQTNSNRNILRHIKRVHNQGQKTNPCKYDQFVQYTPECAQSFSNNPCLEQCTPSILLSVHCTHCNYKTNSNRNLSRHVKRVHLKKQQNDLFVGDDQSLLFVCSECTRRFAENHQLMQHLVSTHGHIFSDSESCFEITSNVQQIDPENIDLVNHEMSPVIERGIQQIDILGDNCVESTNVKCTFSPNFVSKNSPLESKDLTTVGLTWNSMQSDHAGQRDLLGCSAWTETPLSHYTSSNSSPIPLKLFRVLPTVDGLDSGSTGTERFSLCDETNFRNGANLINASENDKEIETLDEIETDRTKTQQSAPLCDETNFRNGANLINLLENDKEIETLDEIEIDHTKTLHSAPDKTREGPLLENDKEVETVIEIDDAKTLPSRPDKAKESILCYKCTVCNFMCFGLELPRNHSHKVLPFCTFCSRSFSKESILKTHHCQLHTKDKLNLNSCPHSNCDFTYHRANDLDQHEQAEHKQNRFFKCDLQLSSNKCVATEKKNQQNMFTDGKRFVCSWKDCGRSFRDSFNLKTHIKTHTGAKTKFCNLCDFSCIQKTSMDWHIKKKHSRMTKSQLKRATTELENDGNSSASVKTLYVQIETNELMFVVT